MLRYIWKAIGGRPKPDSCFLLGRFRRTPLPKERYGESLRWPWIVQPAFQWRGGHSTTELLRRTLCKSPPLSGDTKPFNVIFTHRFVVKFSTFFSDDKFVLVKFRKVSKRFCSSFSRSVTNGTLVRLSDIKNFKISKKIFVTPHMLTLNRQETPW